MRAMKVTSGVTAVTLLGALGFIATTHPWSSHTADERARERQPHALLLGQLGPYPRELCEQSARSLAVYLAAANDPTRARTVLSINFGHVCPYQVVKVHQAWQLAAAAADNLR